MKREDTASVSFIEHLKALVVIIVTASTAVLMLGVSSATSKPAQSEIDNYLKVKQAATDQARKQNVLTRLKYSEGDISLGLCQSWGEDLGLYDVFDTKTASLVDLAGYVYQWDHELSQVGSGIPREVWRPLIEEVEMILLDKITTGKLDIVQTSNIANRYARYMGETLVAWGKRNHAKRMRIYVFCEGGAGGPRDIEMKSEPPGAALWLISEFSYELCKFDRDPNDRLKCTDWRKVEAGGKAAVSGFYYVHASWPDGTLKTERYDFRSVKQNESITIGK